MTHDYMTHDSGASSLAGSSAGVSSVLTSSVLASSSAAKWLHKIVDWTEVIQEKWMKIARQQIGSYYTNTKFLFLKSISNFYN